jgi:hypothetical protein
VNQLNFETAFMFKGFSWQSEMHWKEIIDNLDNDQTTMLSGYYLQMGYFFHQSFSWWPTPLEMAIRHATYNPDVNVNNNEENETSLAFNWFFNGHKNKLTFETSYFNFQDPTTDIVSDLRYRIQWDISL